MHENLLRGVGTGKMLTFRAQALEGDLFPQTTATLLRGAHVGVFGCESALEQPSAEFRAELSKIESAHARRETEGTYAGLAIESLNDENEWR
jgi:hypothetical protein